METYTDLGMPLYVLGNYYTYINITKFVLINQNTLFEKCCNFYPNKIMEYHFNLESRFYLLLTIKIFMMMHWHFPDDMLRILWWQVNIFLITGQDLQYDRSRFSWWQVKIFSIAGQDLQYDRSKLSVWQEKVFDICEDFHDNRLK